MPLKIGIIGYGRFGELAARYLSDDFTVSIFTSKDSVHHGKKEGISELPEMDIIIPCVPICEFEGCILAIRNHLKQGAIVIDVCSVKEYPVKIMKRHLPANVGIIATHPMFGPDSASDSLEGRKIVIHNVSALKERYSSIKKYLVSKKLIVIEATPEVHDRQIAESLLLTHFLGRGLLEFGAQPKDIDTEGYRRLLTILDVVKHDTWQLFKDMNKYNRFAKEIRQRLIEALQKVEDKLE